MHLPYIDLTFAFGLATSGDAAGAQRLFAEGAAALRPLQTVPGATDGIREWNAVVASEVRRVLLSMFRFRIEQALAGVPHTEPVSGSALADWEELVRQATEATVTNPYKRAEHAVGVYRMVSRVLEPVDRVDPYRVWAAVVSDRERRLLEAANLRDPAAIARQVGELVQGVVSQAAPGVDGAHTLCSALPLALRAGSEFTAEVLARARVVAASATDATAAGISDQRSAIWVQAELLKQCLLVAGLLGRTDLAGDWAELFVELAERLPEELRVLLVCRAGPQCLLALRALGDADHTDRVIIRLRAVVPKALPPDAPALAAQTLGAELVIAAGWLALGRGEQAEPVLWRARHELLGPVGSHLQSVEYTELARTYTFALGQGGAEPGLQHLTSLFSELPPGKVTNTWTTAEHFSRSHLLLTEEAVAAACQLACRSSA